jgi:peptidoglycan hydrolase CwlO-like protein
MWDDAKQQRLDELRQRVEREPLPVNDQRALEALLHELEETEWAAVRPAMSRFLRDQETLAADMGQLQTRNAVLAALADRYADLFARAKAQVAELTSEREALRREYERAVR